MGEWERKTKSFSPILPLPHSPPQSFSEFQFEYCLLIPNDSLGCQAADKGANQDIGWEMSAQVNSGKSN
jgi:hypothetical protein